MGCTIFEVEKLKWVIETYKPENVIELGSQTNYTTSEQGKPPFMSEWFKDKVIDYCCIDLAGDNNAITLDLSIEHNQSEGWDLVTDFGTSEHIVVMGEYISVPFHEGYINSVYPKGEPTEEQIKLGYYNCWLNKFHLCKIGGIIFSANPLTENWPGHGYSYICKDFYNELVKISGLEIIEQGIHAASGNNADGHNLWSILIKNYDLFPTFDEFYSNLPVIRK